MTRGWLVGLLLLALDSPRATAPEPQLAGDLERLRTEGLALLEQGDLAEAIAKLEQVRAGRPKDLELRLALGMAYLKQGAFQQALNETSEVLKSDPNHLEANLGRAQALIGLGDGPKAVGPAKLVTELAPNDARAWHVLGEAYAHDRTKDYPRAETAFQKELRLNPANREAAVQLARALSYQKKVKEAVAVLEDVLRQHPEDAFVTVKLAESYYALQKLDRAEELLKKALERDPGNEYAGRVLDQVRSRQAFNFWVPVVAIVVFPSVYLLVRWIRRGRTIKV